MIIVQYKDKVEIIKDPSSIKLDSGLWDVVSYQSGSEIVERELGDIPVAISGHYEDIVINLKKFNYEYRYILNDSIVALKKELTQEEFDALEGAARDLYVQEREVTEVEFQVGLVDHVSEVIEVDFDYPEIPKYAQYIYPEFDTGQSRLQWLVPSVIPVECLHDIIAELIESQELGKGEVNLIKRGWQYMYQELNDGKVVYENYLSPLDEIKGDNAYMISEQLDEFIQYMKNKMGINKTLSMEE